MSDNYCPSPSLLALDLLLPDGFRESSFKAMTFEKQPGVVERALNCVANVQGPSPSLGFAPSFRSRGQVGGGGASTKSRDIQVSGFLVAD